MKFDRPSQDNVRHEAVASIVSSCFPEARMDQYTPSEIWVSLPQEEIGHLIPTVATLEQESSRLGICDISLTTPTLVKIFSFSETRNPLLKEWNMKFTQKVSGMRRKLSVVYTVLACSIATQKIFSATCINWHLLLGVNEVKMNQGRWHIS